MIWIILNVRRLNKSDNEVILVIKKNDWPKYT